MYSQFQYIFAYMEKLLNDRIFLNKLIAFVMKNVMYNFPKFPA